MTPLREAVVLPALFLTVALLGGLRVGDSVRFLPPALDALTLALIMVAALARARVLAPEALMHAGRSPLENLCGVVVLIALFAASAQTFNLLTPERGLLRAMFSVFFFVQLLTMLTAVASRRAMLRSLVVLLGAAFILRFLILESLYAADSSFLQRVLTAALEGVTLGAVEYQPHAAITGYAAFLTLIAYLTGLLLLFPVPHPLHMNGSGGLQPSSSALRARDPGSDAVVGELREPGD